MFNGRSFPLYRPPIGCNPHTVQIQPCALNLIPSGFQLEELTVAQNEVVVLIDPTSTQINILPVAVDDEVLTRSWLLDGDGHTVDGDAAAFLRVWKLEAQGGSWILPRCFVLLFFLLFIHFCTVYARTYRISFPLPSVLNFPAEHNSRKIRNAFVEPA